MRLLFTMLILSVVFTSCSTTQIVMGTKPAPVDTAYVELKSSVAGVAGERLTGHVITIKDSGRKKHRLILDTIEIPINKVYAYGSKEGIFHVPMIGHYNEGAFARKIYEGKLNVWQHMYAFRTNGSYNFSTNSRNPDHTQRQNSLYVQVGNTDTFFSLQDRSIMSYYSPKSISYKLLTRNHIDYTKGYILYVFSLLFLIAGCLIFVLAADDKTNTGKLNRLLALAGVGIYSIGALYAFKLMRKYYAAIEKSVAAYNGVLDVNADKPNKK